MIHSQTAPPLHISSLGPRTHPIIKTFGLMDASAESFLRWIGVGLFGYGYDL